MKVYGLFIFLSILFESQALAQKNVIDSLTNQLVKSKNDTNKVLILNDLAYSLLGSDTTKTKQYLEQGLQLSRQLGFLRGEVLLLNVLGEYYHRQGYYVKGIEYVNQSLKLAEKTRDDLNIANTNYMLAIIYTDGLKQYDMATRHSLIALPIFQKLNYNPGIVNTYNLLAWIYAITKQKLNLAHLYNEKSLLLAKKIKDDRIWAYCIGTKALIFDQENQLDSALFYFFQANEQLEKVKDEAVIAYNQVFIGEIYCKQIKYQEAINIFYQAIKTSKKVNAREFLKEAYQGIAKIYALQSQFDQAYPYHLLYVQMKDSLNNWENTQKIALMRGKYEEEKHRTRIIILEKEKQLALEETRAYLILFLGGAFSFLVILGLILRYNQMQKKANLLLQEKNEEIAQQAEELQVSHEEVMAQRDSLEEKVQERTQTLAIAHEKLRNYAFSNSHKVRRPVATLLGLLYLFNQHNLLDPFNLDVLDMLRKTAQELDEVTREINQNLEDMEE